MRNISFPELRMRLDLGRGLHPFRRAGAGLEFPYHGCMSTDKPPGTAGKGRGAVTNLQGRFEKQGRETFDDGWQPEPDDEPPRLVTQVIVEQARSILSRNASPDLPFNVSLKQNVDSCYEVTRRK